MSFIPKPQEIYKHFKGNLYQITAIAEHTETGETLVVYQALYGEYKIYARPLAMFISRVDKVKYPEVTQEFRFELQGPDAGRQKAEMSENEQVEMKQPETEQLETGQPKVEQLETMRSETTQPKAEQLTEEKASGSDVGTTETKPQQESTTEEELPLDPLVLEFLDADTYEERLNILAALHHRITDEMITTMAIACDVEVNEGTTEEKYESLKTCLITLQKYECSRLR